jgi:hypothetical protein
MATPLRGTVKIRVADNVTLDHVNALVARVAGLSGCTHCGLLGVDLRLGGDPVEAEQLAKLPGVKALSFGG